jgi:hypothetical protein
MWRRTALVLELAVLASATGAGVLTARTLVLNPGTTPLTDLRSAAFAWLLCACLAGFGATLGARIPPEMVARHRRPLTLLLAAALGWMLLGLVRPAVRAGNGLLGQYYANTTWDGWPAQTVSDPVPSASQMSQRWIGKAPPAFSVVWTGYLAVGRAGSYSFATTSDDGSRLYIDDQLVVDNGGEHGPTTRSGRAQLTRGSHRVRLEYVEFGAGSELIWSWAREGGRYSPVPAWALSRRQVHYGTVMAARVMDWGLRSAVALIVLATAWYLRTGLASDSVRAIRGEIAQTYPDTATLVFSAFALVVILLVPWPAGQLFRAVDATIRDLNRTAFAMLADFDTFQANLTMPQTGEYAVGARVEEMLAMLRRHGVNRYRVSASIAADDWVSQQIVASAWPRKREADARAAFVLNTEPVPPGCTLVDRQQEVSLVHCP